MLWFPFYFANMYQEKFPGARDSFCLRGEAYFRTLQYDFNKFELFMEGGGVWIPSQGLSHIRALTPTYNKYINTHKKLLQSTT